MALVAGIGAGAPPAEAAARGGGGGAAAEAAWARCWRCCFEVGVDYEKDDGAVCEHVFEQVLSMFHFVSIPLNLIIAQGNTGAHWGQCKAGWETGQFCFNPHFQTENIKPASMSIHLNPNKSVGTEPTPIHLTPSEFWIHLNPSESLWMIKCSDKPIGGWPDRAEPETCRSTQVI